MFYFLDYTTNKALGKWVAKQREQYKLLKKGEHSFLTPDRLEQLNSIGFVWSMKGRAPKEEDEIEDEAIAAAKVGASFARNYIVYAKEYCKLTFTFHFQKLLRLLLQPRMLL